MLLQDQVVVVTGASRGIGRALCERFAREQPAAIAMLDIDLAAAELVVQHVNDAGVNGFAITCDVSSEPQIQSAVQAIESKLGRIDLFCANAGIANAGGAEASNDEWQRVMDVNFMSHVYSTRAVLPGMQQRGGGYFLHTASAAGLLTQVGSAPYAVSKHAAVAFAEWLSMTYGDQGIHVSCLCPQGVMTDMVQGDDPVLTALRETAITTSELADSVVEGLREERFLILPHPEVATYMRNKAENVDRWLGGMRKWKRALLGE